MPATEVICVIPCSAGKGTEPAPARDLYTGPMFRHTMAAAQAAGGDDARVLILSARHGLIDPGTVIEPYDTTMTGPGAVTPAIIAAQAAGLGIDFGAEVYSFLPAAYYRQLDAALRTLDVYPQDVYEATGGIGDQRHVNSVIARVS